MALKENKRFGYGEVTAQSATAGLISALKYLNPVPVPAPFRLHHVYWKQIFSIKKYPEISNKGKVLLNFFLF